MTLNADQLKEVSFWESVYLRIPERWDCIRDSDGTWDCYEPDGNSGWLSVDFDIFTQPEDAPETDEEFRKLSHHIMPQLFSADADYKRKDRTPDHLVFHISGESFDENLGPVHYDNWHHGGICRPNMVMVNLTLVIPTSRLEDDWIVQLRKFMDEELKNTTVAWDVLLSMPVRSND